MNKIHVTVVALILGVAGALGVAAATNTAGLRTSSASASAGVSNATIAARSHRLDKVARALARARRDKPPALPAVPAAHAPAQPPAPRVVYQRPAPVVVVRHTGHHDDGHEQEGGDD